ncbi:MAG: hypothetical protein U0821_16780 [Chloroflexota bacterium]
MSATVVAEILRRALSEPAFAEALRADIGAALTGYDISEEERAAIAAGLGGAPATATLQNRPHKAHRLV